MANLTVEEDGGGDYTTLDEACDNIGAGETITIQLGWDAIDSRNAIISTNCFITATGASRVTTARHVSGSPQHYRLHCSTNGTHCIQVTDATASTTIDGIDIKQKSAGASDECIRLTDGGGTLNIKNCILSSDFDTGSQDGVYVGAISCTINLENVIVYQVQRAGFHSQNTTADALTQTWNINSCSIWDCGDGNALDGGIVIDVRGTNAIFNINIHNTWALSNNNADYHRYAGAGDNATDTWGISYSIDSDNSIASRDGGGSGNQASRTIADADQGVGSYVIVNDITGAAPFDLSLLTLGNAKNNAEDEHTTDSAEGLTIPATDIDGTVRPQNTNHDVGAFEIVSGAPPTGNPWYQYAQEQ